MPLKLVKRPKTAQWIMRGSIKGVRYEESTGVADKKLAEEIRAKREAEILTEAVYGKTLTVTFAHAVADYLEHGSGATRFLQPLLDYFNTTLLKDIEQDAIDVASKKLYPKAGPATRNRQVYTPVSAILRHAYRKGWCPLPTLARPKQPKGVIRWLKPDEANMLIEACAPHLRPLVVFLLYTGARAGEAVWLDWSNVDLAKRQVTFPKTKNGEARSVPLHSRIVQLIANLPHREGAVFLTPAGEPYARPKGDADRSAGSRIHNAFSGACRRAGIENFRVHDCRHTWASWHYQRNHDLAKLQALGGWKTPSMVFRYAHTNVEHHAESIEKLPGGNLGEGKAKEQNNA